MTYDEAMCALEAAGTAQNRKVYARHGVCGPMFGVSYAALNQLKKAIKVDHGLALELWASGVHDARVLATKVADPKRLDEDALNGWVDALDSYPLTDALAELVAQSPRAQALVKRWVGSDEAWRARAGWGVLGRLAAKGEADDALFAPYLDTIQAEIHARPNRVRESMNWALIAIGGRSEALKRKALAVAEAGGPVEVDHGQTSCKTPEASAYIEKVWARKKRRKR